MFHYIPTTTSTPPYFLFNKWHRSLLPWIRQQVGKRSRNALDFFSLKKNNGLRLPKWNEKDHGLRAIFQRTTWLTKPHLPTSFVPNIKILQSDKSRFHNWFLSHVKNNKSRLLTWLTWHINFRFVVLMQETKPMEKEIFSDQSTKSKKPRNKF